MVYNCEEIGFTITDESCFADCEEISFFCPKTEKRSFTIAKKSVLRLRRNQFYDCEEISFTIAKKLVSKTSDEDLSCVLNDLFDALVGVRDDVGVDLVFANNIHVSRVPFGFGERTCVKVDT